MAFGMLLEFVPTASRGVFLVGIEGFWTIGTILQGLLAFLLLNTAGWRIMLAISAIPLGKEGPMHEKDVICEERPLHSPPDHAAQEGVI